MTKKEREAHEERPTAHFISYINPNYSPFDNSSEYITKCSNCGCGLYDTEYYCPICGVKINERVVRSRYNGKIEYSPWIPVSERPTEGTTYLITGQYGNKRYVDIATFDGEDATDIMSWDSYSDDYKTNKREHKVIAYMPLPQPYTESEE